MILKLFDLLLDRTISKETFIVLLEVTDFFFYLGVDCIDRQLHFFIEFDCELLDLLTHALDLFLILSLSELLTLN